MTTKAELQIRIAELEAAQERAEILDRISRELNTANDADELLRLVARPAQEVGARRGTLLYIDLDEAGEPEWLELAACFEPEDMEGVPVGTRYYLPEFPLAHLWLASPGESQVIADIATDERTDEYARDTYARSGIESTAIIPLTQAGRWVGLVSFHWYESHSSDEQEMAIYQALARLVSPAVENLRLIGNLEQLVAERTAQLQESVEEQAQLQQKVIEAQKQIIQELSTPVIPIVDRIIILPLVGSIDSMRARDITRSLLAGIRKHRAKVVILDITGVPIVDSGVASHLNKTIQAARLKGARTIVTGISDAVAETIVELGIEWEDIETLADLQTGLITALDILGLRLTR